MTKVDKTFFVLKPDAHNTNGVAPPSYEGIKKELKARGIPEAQIQAHDSLAGLTQAAKTAAAPTRAVLVVPGGNAVDMLNHLERTGNHIGVIKDLKSLIIQGGSYVGICAGSILAADKMKGRRMLRPELGHVEPEMRATMPRGSMANVLRFLEDKAFDGDLDKVAEAYVPPVNVSMLGLATGITAQPFAYFAQHATRDVKDIYPGIKSEIRTSQNELAHVANIAGPTLLVEDEEEAEVLGRYGDLPGKPAAIVRTDRGLGTVTLSAVHPELRDDTAPAEQQGRDKVFDTLFGLAED